MVEPDPDGDPIEQDNQLDDDLGESDGGYNDDDFRQHVEEKDATAEVDALAMCSMGARYLAQPGSTSQMEIDEESDRPSSTSEGMGMQIDHAPLNTLAH